MGNILRHLAFLLFALGGLYATPAAAQRSTAAHPCGDPADQFKFSAPPEVPRTGTKTTIDMTVKQDSFRLCFVWNGIAEAPVIRARPGDHIVLRVTSRISDPCYINNYFGGTCPASGGARPDAMASMQMGDDEVKGTVGTYPIEPNTLMAATGFTNVHTHGLEISPALHQDEVLRTKIVPPGTSGADKGSSRWTYEYTIPVAHPPGLYWYHPHYHGETEAQAMMGLSGAIVIEDAQDARRAAANIAEQVIIVRDIATNQAPKTADIGALLAEAGVVGAVRVGARATRNGASNPNAVSTDPHIDEKDEVACGNGVAPSLFEELTVNRHYVQEGAAKDSALPAVATFPGEVRLIRLLNAASDSFIVPHLVQSSSNGAKTDLPLRVVALDGVPLTDADGKRQVVNYAVGDRLNIPPGGRVEFILNGPPAGAETYLASADFNTGCAGDLMPKRVLLRFVGTNPQKPQDNFDWTQGATPWLNPAYDTAPAAERTIAFIEYPHSFTKPGSDTGTTDFYITEIAGPDVTPSKVKIVPFDMSGPPNITINLNNARSRVEEWTIQNYTVEAHAFHIHQIHFREVKAGTDSTEGQPLLDDIFVPIAQVNADGTPGKPGQVKLKLVFTPAIAGTFPFHCHNLYHEDNGMMGTIKVVP